MKMTIFTDEGKREMEGGKKDGDSCDGFEVKKALPVGRRNEVETIKLHQGEYGVSNRNYSVISTILKNNLGCRKENFFLKKLSDCSHTRLKVVLTTRWY